MDRRVKERLIGASILVAIVVLVVPELLSGPKANVPQAPRPIAIASEPIRTVTVDLATSKAPATSDAELPNSPPPPAAGAPSGTPNGNPSAAAAAPAAAAVETPAPSPISAVRAPWAVQLGSFANRANADKLARELKAQGLAPYVSSGGTGQSLRYRVRVGPLADREAADRMAAKLKSLGHDSTIVAPGS